MQSSSPSGFVGRGRELKALARAVGTVRAGTPQVVWVRGPAGIGKTSLLRQFLVALSGFTVLRATADPAESIADYGVVGQLVRRVPARIRAATPLLAGDVGTDANPMAVGAQLLDLIGQLQRNNSVAIAIDDVHWADAASVQALGFVLRRIWADQVLVLLAGRPPADPGPSEVLDRLSRSCPESVLIHLGGFDTAAVSRLAQLVLGRGLPERAIDRLRTCTAGHPLLLRTLLTEIPAEQLADTTQPLTIPRSAVAAVDASLRRLPAETRDLLGALAVLGTRSPLARVAHISRTSRPMDALQPAIEAGLVQWWPDNPVCPVTLAHGLQREAIYKSLTPARRSLLHSRAAEVVDRGTAWAHRVAACTSSDDRLAAELDDAAAVEAAAGRHAVAAAYLRWAADLSPDQAGYERRTLTSGVQVVFSKDRRSARPLAVRAQGFTPSALRSLFLGLCALLVDGQWSLAADLLGQSLEQAEDPAVERWISSTAAALLAGALTWSGDSAEAIRQARAALAMGGLPTLLADYTRVLLAVGVAREQGMARGLDELSHLARNPSAVPAVQLDTLSCRGAILTMLGRFAAAKRDLTDVVGRHRSGTFLIGGTTPYAYLAACHYQLGEWDQASIVMQQSLSLADEDEQPQNHVLRHFCASLVPSGRGDWAKAGEHVRLARGHATTLGSPQDLRSAALAEALLHHAQGDLKAVLAVLRRVPGVLDDWSAHTWWSLWWRPLLIEALLATGQREQAAAHLTVLRESLPESPYLAVVVARLDALLAEQNGDQQAALTFAVEHVERDSRIEIPLSDGLLEHEHGRRLLVAGRCREAASWLRSAKVRFATLAAAPYARRVDEDLARCGYDHGRSVAMLSALTGREAEIVHLVDRQLTNREIGAQLFVTTKTVEYHLGNIYAKLGISSRRQLRELLAAHRDALASATEPGELGPVPTG